MPALGSTGLKNYLTNVKNTCVCCSVLFFSLFDTGSIGLYTLQMAHKMSKLLLTYKYPTHLWVFFSSSLAICQINQFPAYCPALSHNLHFVDYILAASFTCSCVLSTSCKLAAGSRSLGRAGVTWLRLEDHNTPNRDTVKSLVPKNHTRATDLNKSLALIDNFLLKGNRRHQHSKKQKSI